MLSKLKTVILRIIKIFNISSKYIGPPKGSLTTQEWMQKRFPTFHPPYYPIYNQKIIVEKPPKTIPGKEISWRFRSYYRRLRPASFVLKISDGRVWGTKGAVITDDNYLLSDVSREWMRNMYLNLHSAMRQLSLGRTRKLKGNVAVIATEGANNYWHWMFDILPRFGLLKKAGIIDDIDLFIMPPYTRLREVSLDEDFSEFIEKLGIFTDKLIFSNSNRFHVQAEHLYVPSLPSLQGADDKWVCEFLRSIYLKKTYTPVRYSKYIYITRRNSKYRKSINEKRILSLLEPLGFEIIECEKLSVRKKAEIFNNAECIIAGNGAGLTNIVFCKENCKVIVLCTPSFVAPTFWILANQLNLEYYYLFGKGTETDEFGDFWKDTNRDDDTYIEIESLKKILKEASII